MRESTFPLEQMLGMELYTTDTPGIGGVLRRQAEDFVVEEIPQPIEGTGPYLVCRLTKKNWELQRLVKEIARSLGVSHRRVAWAGTKDKHAVTTQLISLYDIEPEAIQRIHFKDVVLEVVGRSPVPLSLGMLRGNTFSLWIRECDPEDLAARVCACEDAVHSGILNYYGVQRFGARRPITHLVGEYILRGDFEGAVNAYVGQAFPDEPPETRIARESFACTGDAKAALRDFPTYLSYERALLHALTGAPDRYQEVLLVLPPKLLSMFVSAFQSYLFNAALSARGKEGSSLTIPVVGDFLVFADGRTDQVTPGLLSAALLQVERGRAVPALFIPGSRVEEWKRASPRVLQILEERGITPAHFQRAQKVVRAAFQGFHRPIVLSTPISSQIDGADVHLEFTLAPGQYATTVCRELMKGDPLSLV
ncbi:MAG: tRNA pseudouridine(13) synthase TruD [Methanomicrobiales archaeon]|nr:tRNA pseudouridine(13) synthase TruD [Methanomicrobiales archaeon]